MISLISFRVIVLTFGCSVKWSHNRDSFYPAVIWIVNEMYSARRLIQINPPKFGNRFPRGNAILYLTGLLLNIKPDTQHHSQSQ